VRGHRRASEPRAILTFAAPPLTTIGTFALDGSLKGVPKGGHCTQHKKDLGLTSLPLASFRGFLFVNADPQPKQALEAALGNLPALILDQWPLEDMVTVRRATYDVPCNWKFLMENTSETYHTSYVHGASLGSMPSSPCKEVLGQEPLGDWDAVHIPYQRSVVPLPSAEAPFPEVAPSTYFVNLFPCLQVNVTKDCAWWMRLLPTSAASTRVTMGFLFPKATAAMPDFDAKLEHYLYRWDLAVREDNEISVNQQEGVGSHFYRPGPYHELEFATHKFDRWVVQRCLGGASF